MKLRVHWRLLQGGETGPTSRAAAWGRTETGIPDLGPQAEFCRAAEQAGMTGLLVDVGMAKPDPILLAAALGPRTETIQFIVAYRSGMIPPTTFAQQLNTLSHLTGGRFSLNIVAGHSPGEQRAYGDFLPHDDRYERTGEFLEVCHRLWSGAGPISFEGRFYRVEGARLNTPLSIPGRSAPEIFIGGGSLAARELALSQGTCWMRMADTPGNVAESAKPVLDAGKEVGLRMAVLARPTRGEAVDDARRLVAGADPSGGERGAEGSFISRSDSVSFRAIHALAEHEWLSPVLWAGAVRSHGPASLALVGSFEDVAEAILDYGRIGCSHFILSGWPKWEEMELFGHHVLPLVRRHGGDTGPVTLPAENRAAADAVR
jgi:alkanesulfonate monooxygenase